MAGSKNILFLVLIAISIDAFVAMAGTTGKLSGVAKNKSNGEPLHGAAIIVEGTKLGAVTNAEGRYYIINVPPGTYSVRACMVGYKSTSYTSVIVSADLTTHVDYTLEPSEVQLNEIVVSAEKPFFQKDNTAKLAVITGDEFKNLPVSSIQDVLTTKAGFTKDADGEIHARGGRAGEIAYVVDGQYVKEPLTGDFNNTIDKNAVQELSVVSGSFNAEYGGAMSSIVNVVTKDGGEDFHGNVEYQSAAVNTSRYRKANAFAGVSDLYAYNAKSIISSVPLRPLKLEVPLPGLLSLSFNGPLPLLDNISYFVSARTLNEDSYLPHGYDLERDIFSKVLYRVNPSIKIALSAQSSKKQYQLYDHAWKYLSDNQAHQEKTTDRYVLSWTHTLGSDLFYNVQLAKLDNAYKVQVGDKLPSEYSVGLTGTSVYFYVSGDDAQYTDDKTTTYSGKYDITYQLNNYHLFKSGAEVRLNTINVHEENEPWSGGAQFKDIYTEKPVEGVFYIQDKIEYDYLIANLGLRYDYVDPRSSVWPDIKKYGYYDANNNWIASPLQKASVKSQLSPRIGLAHPISDRAVLHFSYGHFFQFPDYHALYYNAKKDLSSSLPLLGNPNLNAQKTVAYETGIKYRIGNTSSLEVSGWYKDITNLLSTYQVSYLSQDYVVYYNSDYASVKGFDITFNERYNQNFSGSINYTYMVAKGNNSQPLGGYVSAYSQEEVPHKENYLDFDRTHNIVVDFNVRTPDESGPEIFGFFPFSNSSLTVLIQASSGLPYTPYVDPSLRVEINSARMPWTSTVDLRALKKIRLGNFSTNFFLEITNLFNTENVKTVYSRTGKPFDTGVEGLVGSSPDANHNPAHLGPPRIVKAGFQFSW